MDIKRLLFCLYRNRLQKILLMVWALTAPVYLSAYYEEPWGKDREIAQIDPATLRSESKPEKPNLSLAGKAAQAVISFHQKFLSPTDGTRSHFRPSSSRYMQLSIQRYGFLRGYLMGCDRLLRENNEEWVYRTIKSPGGVYKYDPAVFDKFSR